MPGLELRDLHAYYGAIEALHGISLRAVSKKITVIIGSNGAGKSTIINSISGFVRRDDSIYFSGKPLSRKPHKVTAQGITQVPEGRQVFVGMTVEENLRLGAYLNSDRKEVQRLVEEQFEMFPRLRERKKQDAGTLSGGEQQMLAIGRGMMSKPKVLLMDEPSLGLAPLIVAEVFEIIKRIRDTGVTIVLVEQNAKKSLAICDYAYVIENGNLIHEGTGAELLASNDIAAAYLGVGHEQQTKKERIKDAD